MIGRRTDCDRCGITIICQLLGETRGEVILLVGRVWGRSMCMCMSVLVCMCERETVERSRVKLLGMDRSVSDRDGSG